jgi:2-hydroxychromene-2-carboxylate isomerase
MVDSLSPVKVTVEWVPILLGALFKETGTPMVPAMHLSAARKAYGQQDVLDWARYGGHIPFCFNSHFPLRTVTALRVSIVEPNDGLRNTICIDSTQLKLIQYLLHLVVYACRQGSLG